MAPAKPEGTGSEQEGPDAANVATITAAVLGAALALGALALYDTRTGLSVAAGVVIAVANLATMSAIIRAVVRTPDEPAPAAAADSADAPDAAAPAEPGNAEAEAPPAPDHAAEGKRGGAAWGGFALVKIIVLFGGIWVLLTKGIVDPIPLVVGYGVLPLGIAASSLLTSLLPRSRSGSRPRSRNK